jgi:hypothetical protein
MELIRSFDFDAISAESGAALFWFLRNSLFFDMGLDERPDVALASYLHTVKEPEPAMRALCAFLDLPFKPELIAHIDRRADRPADRLAIDGRIRGLCDVLQDRLDRAYQAKLAG